MTFWFIKKNMFWALTWIQISLIPTWCMHNRNWWFLCFKKEFLNFSFCISKLAINVYLTNEIQPQRNLNILTIFQIILLLNLNNIIISSITFNFRENCSFFLKVNTIIVLFVINTPLHMPLPLFKTKMLIKW